MKAPTTTILLGLEAMPMCKAIHQHLLPHFSLFFCLPACSALSLSPNMDSCQMPSDLTVSAIPESCSYLLRELKLIWDEVGEDQLERERILLELEQECLEAYKRKVDRANISRIRLHQALAESEAEFTNLLLSLGERASLRRPEKLEGTLKVQLDLITPALQEMQLRKEERLNQFHEVQTEINKILTEIEGKLEINAIVVNEADLSVKKLEEYHSELRKLQKEKNERLSKMKDYIKMVHKLAEILGLEASEVINTIHPSLIDGSDGQKSKNISDAILNQLQSKVAQLEDEKHKRMDKLCRLRNTLTNLWDLVDMPLEERQKFASVKFFKSSASVENVLSSGSLTLDKIHQIESEVERLDQLKASKMKEFFLKKQFELEEICNNSHMKVPSQKEMESIMNLIDSGEMDHSDLIRRMEESISRAEEEADSRKDIIEKVEKWKVSCHEEHWLDEYNRDETRYSVSRGAHKNLKRAERARMIVNKIPVLIEVLIAKTNMWEQERRKVFVYDKVPLLSILQDYTQLRQEQEEEKHRKRERKKMQVQMPMDKVYPFGSRPNTSINRTSIKSLNKSYASNFYSDRKLHGMNPRLS